MVGETHLTLSYEPTDLVVHVTNPVRGAVEGALPAAPGSGYGVVGMRERVDAVGGSVTAGRTGNGAYVVEARIPYAPAQPARTETTP